MCSSPPPHDQKGETTMIHLPLSALRPADAHVKSLAASFVVAAFTLSVPSLVAGAQCPQDCVVAIYQYANQQDTTRCDTTPVIDNEGRSGYVQAQARIVDNQGDQVNVWLSQGQYSQSGLSAYCQIDAASPLPISNSDAWRCITTVMLACNQAGF